MSDFERALEDLYLRFGVRPCEFDEALKIFDESKRALEASNAEHARFSTEAALPRASLKFRTDYYSPETHVAVRHEVMIGLLGLLLELEAHRQLVIEAELEKELQNYVTEKCRQEIQQKICEVRAIVAQRCVDRLLKKG